MTEHGATGTLYIVATPIGNKEDITLRALKILEEVDFILAEDTRHSAPLLTNLGIKKPLHSLHAHNEHEKSENLINEIEKGRTVALISDAGTPLISDPGFLLVQLARKKNIPVVPVPGCCALIAALSAAGIPCDSFLFLGFLPAKQQARQNKLTNYSNNEHTLVFYESTHRIIETLEDIQHCYGKELTLVLAKELTKTFERFIEGTAQTIIEWLVSDAAHRKGEFVLLIPPNPKHRDNAEDERILQVLLTELPLKQAVHIATQLTSSSRNELYNLALTMQKPD